VSVLYASELGVEPSSAAQALTFVGSFLLAAVGVALMWLRERR
jgi:hypothetical protein